MKKFLFYSACFLLLSCSPKDNFEKKLIQNKSISGDGIRTEKKHRAILLDSVLAEKKPAALEKQAARTPSVSLELSAGSGILPPEEREQYRETPLSTDVPEPPINSFDAVAKQLAGLHAPESFPDKNAYDEYSKFIALEWDNLGRNSLSMVKKWSEQNVEPLVSGVSTVFYPFGGPDVAYVSKFFPNASDYILVGLEPIGNFYEIKKHLENVAFMGDLKRSFSTYLQKGFFITSEMVTHLSQKGSMKGTLYLMLLQLSRLGFEILSVDEISLNADGNETPRAKNALDGVKITCRKKENPDLVCRFYYIRANLGNDNSYLNNLLTFIKRSRFLTFVKSASYALHDRTLSNLKNFILDNSYAILQDDTGVPFHCLNNNRWDRLGFGVYSQPTLKIFSSYLQPDLAEFFAKNSKSLLPFKIGYGFSQGRPNLLLAVISAQREMVRQMEELRNKPIGECPSCKEKENAENIKKNEESAVPSSLASAPEEAPVAPDAAQSATNGVVETNEKSEHSNAS